MQFWNELEGQTIDGRYLLRRLMRSEGRGAWFESTAGDPQNTPATISLIEALTDADEVAERLQAAQALKHPNLVTILKVGQVSLDNTLFVYAVMEHIQQSLSDVLQDQSLSPEEGREVAEAIVRGLTAIHQKGMSHGHVEAASVVAIDETVKLRSDCLQIAPAGQADDVAGIGATLFHAFTQRKALTATDAQINHIPAPFAEIVRNTFARRWTLPQIANALKPAPQVQVTQAIPVAPPTPAPLAPAPPAPAPPAPAPPAPAPLAAAPPAPAPPASAPPVPTPPAPVPPSQPAEPTSVKVAPPVQSRPAPAAVAEAPLLLEEEEPEPAHPPRAIKRSSIALYGALAVIALAIIAWWIFRPAATPSPAKQTAPQTVQAPAPVLAPATPAVPVEASAPTGHPVWRVVVYTYKNPQQAKQMADRISGKHPDLDASVFSPKGKKGIYLVTIGGAMDHGQAVKIQDKARRMGLPQDTYAQNFSE